MLELGDEEPECTVIQLDGAGPHFTAGNDLSDLIAERQHEVLACVRDIFTTVSNLRKVLVAVVEGVAVGIGTTILLHCDLVLADSSSHK